jgi:hypothetical protein
MSWLIAAWVIAAALASLQPQAPVILDRLRMFWP